jgi:hypothetical protein
MTTPDYKALCAELVAAWEKGDDIVGAMNRARSALAEGVGVGPTDEELETLVIAIQALVPIVDDGTHLLEAVDKGRDILRRALHNYGTTHPRPIPVAEGAGVGVRDSDLPHLVRFLCQTWAEIDDWACRECGEAITSYPVIQGTANQLALRRIGVQPFDSSRLRPAVRLMDSAARAIAQSGTTHPRPIPVAERLPSVADCDGEGRCWWFHPGCEVTTPFWYLADCGYPDAWLPAPSIPLPGENNG